MEELRDLGRERSAARDEEADPAAGSGPELREHQLVGKPELSGEPDRDRPPGQPAIHRRLAYPFTPVEEPLLDLWPGPNPLQHPAIYLLVQSRHRGHQR